MITIRKENIGDENRINLINQAAFEQDSEARLVDRLRVSSVKQISLVAIFNNQIIGHILLTTAIIKSNHRQISGMGLAPLAVLGVKSEYNNIPNEAFMMYVAEQNIIKNITGIAQYNPEFAKL